MNILIVYCFFGFFGFMVVFHEVSLLLNLCIKAILNEE